MNQEYKIYEQLNPDNRHASQGGSIGQRRERIKPINPPPYDAEREAFFDMTGEELEYYRDRMNEESEAKHGL